jgi:molecular chaperone DnaJ
VSKRDYYEVLGVDRGADDATMKKAYRGLARRHHPDRNSEDPQAAEKFKEATEAYGILSDGAKRERYDVGGHEAVEGRGGAGFDPSSFSDFGDLFSVFGQVFGVDFGGGGGGGGGRARPQRGDDLLHEIELSFEDAALGAEQEISVARLEHCEDCSGSGGKDGSGRHTCERCGGAGRVAVTQGMFRVARPCSACSGEGSTLEDPCDGCDGAGRLRAERSLRVKVPPGVDHGQRIRLSGEGEDGHRGGPPGDLYVQLRVKAHAFFEREGADLHLRLPLSFPQVALGAEITVPTLEGEEGVKLPAGTEAGEIVRLRGRGVPRLQASGRGDLFLHVRVRTPKKLNAKQKKLLKSYADSLEESYGLEEERSFFDKVKDMFS